MAETGVWQDIAITIRMNKSTPLHKTRPPSQGKGTGLYTTGTIEQTRKDWVSMFQRQSIVGRSGGTTKSVQWV
jgi:hypothetical protein